MRRFPQELVDTVVDSVVTLASDRDAVKTCGLVCQGWLPRSRYHVFSEVTLTAANIGPLVQLIDMSSCPLLSYVRSLTLHYNGGPFDLGDLERLHHCPNVTTLHILIGHRKSFMDWGTARDFLLPHLRAWSASAASLVHFDFKHRIMRRAFPLSIMASIICAVPSAETLSLDFVPTLFMDTDNYPAYTPTRLSHLLIDLPGGCLRDCNLLFDWLQSAPVPPPLKSLKFEGEYGPEAGVPALTPFVQRVGSELQSLTLLMFENEGDAVDFLLPILQHTPKLRDLSFICWGPGDVLEIIPHLPVSSLSDLTVFVYEHHDQDVLWHKIDVAIAAFPRLKRFWISSNTRPVLTLPQKRRLFTLADARGIVVEPLGPTIQVAYGED
ncbi:hypothetical protein C8R47DRAFT_259607 [Mycena vitilis]|nr:hypothetical protein C8R47DRAFT_259607 [Mycena vitilis]